MSCGTRGPVATIGVMKQLREQRPAPFLNRRDQYRMLAMVAMLCLVMIAVKLAARPESWYWLVPPAAADRRPSTDRVPSLEELDFRVQDGNRRSLPPGALRATLAETAPEDQLEMAGDEGALSPEIPAQVLGGITDNTLGVRRAEAEAYHLMLARARDLPEEVMAAAARDDVAFTVLMLHSDAYRGKLITVRGDLRRLLPFPIAEENGQGIERLYEGWLLTPDSGTNPCRFLCTKLPPDAPQGESIDPIPVSVTGYFFKRYGYASTAGMHVAPTLLAKTFQILPQPTAAGPVENDLQWYMIGFVGVICMGLVAICWRFFVSDRRFERSRLKQLAAARLDAQPDALTALEDAEVTDPADLFRDMGEGASPP